MGGGAFDWLKTGRIGAKSAKQAEIRLSDLRKVLSIAAAKAGMGCGAGLLTNR
jgi:hypothetical protein